MQHNSGAFRSALIHIYIPSLLMALGMGMIVPAVPFLGETFGLSMGIAVQVVTAQVLGRTLSLLPAGMIHDRFGTKAGMTTGAVIALASAIATAYAQQFWMILVAQFFWACGSILWNLGRELLAVDLVAAGQRGRRISALYGIQTAGEALGPAMGGVILDALGFRSLYLLCAGFAATVLCLSVTIRGMETPSLRPGRKLFNIRAVSLISPQFRATYAILLLATFCAHLRSETFRSMLPLYAVHELGYRATDLGVLFLVTAVVTFIMIMPAGFISDTFGRKWAAVPPALLAGMTFIAYPMVVSIPALLVLSALQGIITGMALGSMTTYTYDIAPHEVRAQLQVMRRTVGELGSFAGPLAGGIITNLFGAGMTFLFFAPFHLLAALLLILGARESHTPKRQVR